MLASLPNIAEPIPNLLGHSVVSTSTTVLLLVSEKFCFSRRRGNSQCSKQQQCITINTTTYSRNNELLNFQGWVEQEVTDKKLRRVVLKHSHFAMSSKVFDIIW